MAKCPNAYRIGFVVAFLGLCFHTIFSFLAWSYAKEELKNTKGKSEDPSKIRSTSDEQFNYGYGNSSGGNNVRRRKNKNRRSNLSQRKTTSQHNSNMSQNSSNASQRSSEKSQNVVLFV
eukprot:899275_1